MDENELVPLILREYQISVFDKLMEFVESNSRRFHSRGFVVMPSGAGKTLIFTEFVKMLNERAIIVAPTRIILEQNIKAMRRQEPEMNISVYHKDEKDLSGQVVFTTYHSLVQLIKKNIIPRDFARVVIFDEVHRSLSLERSRIPDRLNALCIGFTATDKFSVQKNVERIFQNEIYRMHLKEAIEDGVLLPLRGFIAETNVDLSRIRISHNNMLDETVAERMLNIEARNKVARDYYLKNFKNVPAVAFCVSIVHAEALARYFSDSEIKAAAIHCDTPHKIRQEIIRKFNHGELDILCSRDVLIEGWDSGRVAVALNLRPTYSWVLAEQRACRVVRPHKNKTCGIIVEFQDIYRRKDQPLFIHHLFGERKYRQGGFVAAPRKLRQEEEKAVERDEPVYVFEGLQVSSSVQEVVSIGSLSPTIDFNDVRLIKEIFSSKPEIDYSELTSHQFIQLKFSHPKFRGVGDTLARKYLGALWDKSPESYRILVEDVFGDEMFYQHFEVNRSLAESFPSADPSPEEIVFSREFQKAVKRALKTLLPHEEKVIKERFWDEKTFFQIGQGFGRFSDMSCRTRPPQILNKALRKLRHPSRSKRLEPFY
ncbi:DEAD/DEAH box helicase [Patescibacteria group bacterium]|nr:MAG: DEAD/DEAH box helicase [Patescibacteria group bacterium]